MKGGGLIKLGDRILWPDMALASIKPPGRSYAEWDRFLGDCEKAGVVALRSEDPPRFAGLFGMALLRRWNWLQHSRAQALPYQQAEEMWNAAIERDNTAIFESMAENERHRARAQAERDGRKAGEVDFDAFGYAGDLGL